MLGDLQTLKETDEEVIKRLLSSLLKCRDKSLTENSLNRLIILLQITPLTRREKDTMRFVDKLTGVVNEEPMDEEEGGRKLRLHAKRTLVIGKTASPTHLHNARMGDRSKKHWEERLMRDWNTRLPDEGLRSRPMRKARKGDKPSVWGAKKTLRRT